MVVRHRWVPITNDKGNNNKHKEEEASPHLMHNRNKTELVYEHLEDDLFVKKAEFQFSFERNDKMWNVLFVKMSDLTDIMQRINQVFTPK
eukprot:UN04163